MRRIKQSLFLCAVLLTAFLIDAQAMDIPTKAGDGDIPRPASIAGGGILWLGLIVGAGIFLLLRRRQK